jgi:hypothetical protein
LQLMKGSGIKPYGEFSIFHVRHYNLCPTK